MRRDAEIGDSLDLLLDTICNTFGALIFIALLVALLSQSSPTATPSTTPQSDEIIQRQIATARQSLEELKAEAQKAAANRSPESALRARESTLLREVADIEAALAQQDSQSINAVSDAISRDGKSLKDSQDALSKEKARQADLANATATAVTNIDCLKARLSDLEKSTVAVDQKNTRTLRFPREKTKTKSSVFVIFRYGEVYPVLLTQSEPNRTANDIEINDNSIVIRPISGKGVSTGNVPNFVNEFIKSWPRDEFYFTCEVSPDSVSAFNAFSDAVSKQGYDYGWESFSENKLILTSDGAPPPPPL